MNASNKENSEHIRLFARQWFSNSDQIGLTSLALNLEGELRDSEYKIAWETIQKLKFNGYQIYASRQAKRLYYLSIRNKSSPIRIFFDGFWSGFDSTNSPFLTYFIYAARCVSSIVITENPENADIAIYSCFPLRYSLNDTSHCTRILFLGENVNPSYGNFDFSLSSHLESFCNRNVYAPIWLYQILTSSPLTAHKQEYILPIHEYVSESINKYMFHMQELWIPWEKRKDTPIYVGSNHEPFRLEIIEALKEFGLNIEIYGSSTRPIENKLELLCNYKWAICPENSYSMGYITEKLADALVSGCRCIYWGGLPTSARSFLIKTGSINIQSEYSLKPQLKKILMRDNYVANSLTMQAKFVNKAANLSLNNLVLKLRKIIAPYLGK